MRFHVLTLFPYMIIQGLKPSIIGRAAEKNIISLNAVDIRDYTLDRHRKVDDYPYGGGAGMLMQAQPVYDAHRAATGGRPVRTIYVTPQGEPFSQTKAKELSKEEELVFLCGHYEGIDERVLEEIVTDFVSIGDYVLTGGELPAMVMIDAIARLVPGVLGNEFSAEEESFYNDLLEYPQYSRPEIWHGKKVPEVLLSGNHTKVNTWRREQAISRTAERRPDLYQKYQVKQELIKQFSQNKRNHIHMMESLARGRSEILYAGEDAVLLYDSEYKICRICVAEASSYEKISGMVPADMELLVALPPFPESLRKQCATSCECIQMLYTPKVSLPVKHKDIRRLTMEDFAYVWSCMEKINCDDNKTNTGPDIYNICSGYIQERILSGAMYGIYTENRLAGFMGLHREGSLGMLFIEENARRKGLAQSLEAYMVNHLLEKNWIPYVHISRENKAAEKLQDKLGFYKAPKTVLLLR